MIKHFAFFFISFRQPIWKIKHFIFLKLNTKTLFIDFHDRLASQVHREADYSRPRG